MPTRGIPFPAGDPSLDPKAEKAWRRRLLETALVAVSTEVHKPTIFDPALVPALPAGAPA